MCHYLQFYTHAFFFSYPLSLSDLIPSCGFGSMWTVSYSLIMASSPFWTHSLLCPSDIPTWMFCRDFQLSHLVITLCSLAILLCYLLVELPLSHLMIIKKNFNCSHFILAVSSNSLGTTESTSAVSPEEFFSFPCLCHYHFLSTQVLEP